jgi:hypothetical protein
MESVNDLTAVDSSFDHMPSSQAYPVRAFLETLLAHVSSPLELASRQNYRCILFLVCTSEHSGMHAFSFVCS